MAWLRPLLAALLTVAGPAGCGSGEQGTSLYCYRSLADPVCYERPLASDRGRLTGWIGPPPPGAGAPP